MIELNIDYPSDDNVGFKEIIYGYLKNGVCFEIHVRNEETELIAHLKKLVTVKNDYCSQNMVIEGVITDDFKELLLSLPKPKDTDIYNKMIPFPSINIDKIFYSENYGTLIRIDENADKPYSCRCCNDKTFAVPPQYSLGYICPTCFWEDDVFITSDDGPSDLNHGLTLNEGRINYRIFGNSCEHKQLEVAMADNRIYKLVFGEMYPLYVAKAEKKGRTADEVDEIIKWLTGYTKAQIQLKIEEGVDMECFFKSAPNPNPNRVLITGSICVVKIAEIEDPIVKEVRYLDKLIDELAKGKAMEKILRK